MPWTLNDALQECARNTYMTKQMIRTSTGYSGKGLEYAVRFLSGINYAMRKIARERVGQYKTQTVTLDSQARFLVSTLTGEVLRVVSVKANEDLVVFEVRVDETVEVPGMPNTAVTVNYEVSPPELTMGDLDVQLPIDERYIDPRVLCQYANYQFLSEMGTDYDTARAQVWLGLFNDSFTNINALNRRQRKVRYTG